MLAQDGSAVVVASRILKTRFQLYPCLTNAALKHMLRSELSIPLQLNRSHQPEAVTLTKDRIKQAIKETSTREKIREYKDTGVFTSAALNEMQTTLMPIVELMHFFWRQIDIVRRKHPDAYWLDSNLFVSDSGESLEYHNLSFTLHYGT